MTNSFGGNFRYDIKKQLETGAQGTVVSAFDTVTKSTVAIKIFDLSVKHADYGFHNECSIFESLKGKSKHICEVYDCFLIKNKYGFIVMKQYEGDLFDYTFSNNKTISEKEVKRIFRKICKGVRELHKSGVAHLDLKPENVVMDSNNNPFICDFGSSFHFAPKKTLLGSKPTKKPIEGLNGRGTRRYSAPEVFESESAFNPYKADIYSLGIILHALLTGFYPNQPNSSTIDLTHARNSISADCFELLNSLLSNSPSDRPSIDVILASKWLKTSTIAKLAKMVQII